MEHLPKQNLQQELEQKEAAYWDAHDAFMIAREALAAVRNLIKERTNDHPITNQ